MPFNRRGFVRRAARVRLTVRQIAERAGQRLPSAAKRPDTVIARDLALNLRRLGEESRFARTGRRLFTLREFVGKAARPPCTCPNHEAGRLEVDH